MENSIMDYYEEEIEYDFLDAIAYTSDFETLLDDGDEEVPLDNVSKVMRKAGINKITNRR